MRENCHRTLVPSTSTTGGAARLLLLETVQLERPEVRQQLDPAVEHVDLCVLHLALKTLVHVSSTPGENREDDTARFDSLGDIFTHAQVSAVEPRPLVILASLLGGGDVLGPQLENGCTTVLLQTGSHSTGRGVR